MVKHLIFFLTALLLQLNACNLVEDKFEKVSSLPQSSEIQHRSSTNKKLPSLAEAVVAFSAENFPEYAQITLSAAQRFNLNQALILSRAYRDRFDPAYKKLLVCLTDKDNFQNYTFEERCYAKIEYIGPQLATEKVLEVKTEKVHAPGWFKRSIRWISDLFK